MGWEQPEACLHTEAGTKGIGCMRPDWAASCPRHSKRQRTDGRLQAQALLVAAPGSATHTNGAAQLRLTQHSMPAALTAAQCHRRSACSSLSPGRSVWDRRQRHQSGRWFSISECTTTCGAVAAEAPARVASTAFTQRAGPPPTPPPPPPNPSRPPLGTPKLTWYIIAGRSRSSAAPSPSSPASTSSTSSAHSPPKSAQSCWARAGRRGGSQHKLLTRREPA